MQKQHQTYFYAYLTITNQNETKYSDSIKYVKFITQQFYKFSLNPSNVNIVN